MTVYVADIELWAAVNRGLRSSVGRAPSGAGRYSHRKTSLRFSNRDRCRLPPLTTKARRARGGGATIVQGPTSAILNTNGENMKNRFGELQSMSLSCDVS